MVGATGARPVGRPPNGSEQLRAWSGRARGEALAPWRRASACAPAGAGRDDRAVARARRRSRARPGGSVDVAKPGGERVASRGVGQIGRRRAGRRDQHFEEHAGEVEASQPGSSAIGGGGTRATWPRQRRVRARVIHASGETFQRRVPYAARARRRGQENAERGRFIARSASGGAGHSGTRRRALRNRRPTGARRGSCRASPSACGITPASLDVCGPDGRSGASWGVGAVREGAVVVAQRGDRHGAT